MCWAVTRRPSVPVMPKNFKEEKILFQTAWYVHSYFRAVVMRVIKGKVFPVLN
jgi:hypothetical protein